MRFLIDECLHTSLVGVAQERGHEASHVNWLGLSGETDWGLMPRIVEHDFTFVTNNAADFRRLYANEPIHAGLVIFVPQVPPALQRALFSFVLDWLDADGELINEAVEISIEGDQFIMDRYTLPAAGCSGTGAA